MKSLGVLTLLLASVDLFACSCGEISKINSKAVKEAREIFIGKVIKIEAYDYRSRKITFQVIRQLKMDSVAQIEVLTGLSGADCGLTIEEGQTWYMFTYNRDKNSWAGLCGRSAQLSDHSFTPDSYGRKNYRRLVKQYRKEKARVKREMRFIRKNIV